MILGEIIKLIDMQCGDVASPQENKIALGWALGALASKAAEASGPRMKYEYRFDLIKDTGTYKLPIEIRAVKHVWNDTLEVPIGYSLISSHAESFIQDGTPVSPYGGSGAMGYWINHRILNILPKPISNAAGKLRVVAYASPPVPREFEEEVGIPPEAERWVIAKAAAMRLPPPRMDRAEAIGIQLALAEADLKDWLWIASADIPPGPLEDGVLQ